MMREAMASERQEGKLGVPSTRSRRRLLVIGSHVVQYSSPIFEKLAQDPRLEILVAYCSMRGAEAHIDPEFGVEVAWDTPVLEGFPWVHVPNRSLRPGLGRFFGLFNPGLWELIRNGKFDAMLSTGYFYASAWVAILAARWHGVPILLATDGHNLRTWNARSAWKQRLKKILVRRIFALGEVILAGSSGSVEYLKSLGISSDRILLGRNVVDNNWWLKRAAEVEPGPARENWRIPASAPVVLFCAKLQPWKAPQDVLEAFARAHVPGSYLLFAGDGPLRKQLEERAHSLGISERVRFLGFVNQLQLPSVYRASNLLVLPSLYEPFGFVVSEAMLCGCPAAVSDCVGAKYDLVREGETGYVFPAGDIGALAAVLQDFFSDPDKRVRMGEAVRKRMQTWSPTEYVDALAKAVDLAVQSRRQKDKGRA
jgi:glycosyltransferase involved in cell wall biosynthesis